ncbi:uncharacterized protein EV420DRAFT_537705 [Desarmillaria tabescens]|uniref:DUF6533 domain-containing protein n=1 Tax=Armillaria tabescens TaxID=1929756 RepID=A0AA39N4L1_ARMTA|nr:uncharacterized protein EV420DRAFT_537705 [Desarmillaria tabescens]KAK0457055.1 hypothetical protein EV420DRAFT_537705 [Desarmillaria tabescens]
MANGTANDENDEFADLYRGNLIPLHIVLVGLTWIVHDYLVTLEDEIRYIWPQKRNIGKILFLWVRYYSISLLAFDAIQIHVFSIPGVPSDDLCVAVNAITRITGAIALWSVEIVMQLRVYTLFGCSKKVAAIHGFLFASSIAAFLWILIHNVVRQGGLIADAVRLPLPGCPSVHTGIEWAQWVPATAYEIVLFGFAIMKTVGFLLNSMMRGHRKSLHSILLRDNILYFLAISCILVFNNLMVVGVTKIPWFSFGPFHAAIGVLTTRMLINLRKATSRDMITLQFPWTQENTTAPQEVTETGQVNSLYPLTFQGVTVDSRATENVNSYQKK